MFRFLKENEIKPQLLFTIILISIDIPVSLLTHNFQRCGPNYPRQEQIVLADIREHSSEFRNKEPVHWLLSGHELHCEFPDVDAV